MKFLVFDKDDLIVNVKEVVNFDNLEGKIEIAYKTGDISRLRGNYLISHIIDALVELEVQNKVFKTIRSREVVKDEVQKN